MLATAVKEGKGVMVGEGCGSGAKRTAINPAQ
jgi:hypothetical protein